MINKKRITGLIALALCAVMVFSGQGWAEEFGWPTPGITGLSTIYYYSNGTPHSCRYKTPDGRPAGVDILAPRNTEVLAPAPGTVKTRADLGNTSFGRYIELQHSDGTITLYGHLNEFKVSQGQSVERGQVIALSGTTGNSTGYHLHYEMSNMDTYRYYENNGYNDPRYMNVPTGDNTAFSQGLRNLTSIKYAKIFTLTSGRYYNLYSNKELTSRLSSSAWTGENDEVWLLDVGVNSSNVVYAHISYPISSGRREAYARLRELFVKGTVNNGVITAKNNGYGLYKRLNSGQNWTYGIDAGDKCYLLTYENNWCQVLYPITGRSYSRIAWMPASQFYQIFEFWPPSDDSGSVQPPTITGTNNIPAQPVVGSSYRGTITATGATPITWKVSNGTPPSSASNYRIGLPPGLSISGSGTTGTISGYPSHTSNGQSSFMPLYYFFNVTATNAGGDSAPKSCYIVVYEPPVFETSATLAKGDVNQYYSQTITAKGTEFSMSWKIIEGKLPPGLKFTASSSKRTATISGTPTQAGYYRFKVRCYNLVGNSNTTTTRWFTITVGRNVAAEYLNSSNLPFTYTFRNAPAGKSYSDWVGVKDTKSGTKDPNNYMFSVSDGELPPGLYLDEESSSTYTAGKIYLRGVPMKAGTYNFTLKAKRISDGGYNTKSFTVKITSAATTPWRNYNMSTRYYFICTSTSPKLRVSYSDYFTVSGGSSPYTPSVVAGELPPGMTLEQSGNRTYLTGVPKRYGQFPFTVRVTGSNGGYVDKVCNVTVVNNPLYKSGGTSKASKPKFTSKLLPDAYIGSMWEATLDASGKEPIAWSAEDTLPEWLTLEEATGRIYGIPMEKGKYRFRIKAENEIGSVTKTFKVKVVRATPAISTAEVPEGYVGVPYETRLEASGTDPIKWSKIGKLPSGLKLDKTMGIISGTPRKSGSFDITIKAKNKAGTDMIPLTIVIRPSADEPETKDDEEEEESDDDNDEESGDLTADTTDTTLPVLKLESEAQQETVTETNGSGIFSTKLYALIGGEKLEGAVNTESGKPLAFEIGAWVDEYGRNVDVSGETVFVNDEPVGSADISDEGIFTLPDGIVSGEITVYVSAQAEGREIRTLEVNAVAAEESQTISGAVSGGNEQGSTGGCNFSLIGLAGLIFCGIAAAGKKQ